MSETHLPLRGCRVLVTRPAHQAAGQVAKLKALGAEVGELALIEIAAIDEQDAGAYQAIKSRILDLDLYQGVIFISANAARLGAQWIHDYWPQLPLGVHWFAIGAATTAALRREQIEAYHSAAGDDSEALLQDPALAQIQGQKFLILRGEGGRELLAETLRARGAQIDYVDLYRRRCPDYAPALIKSTIYGQELSVILITSGEALNNLLQLAGSDAALLRIQIIVPSQRVAAMAQARGFTRIEVAEGADDDAMIRALLSARGAS